MSLLSKNKDLQHNFFISAWWCTFSFSHVTEKGCYTYTILSHTIHIPVKNSYFCSFLIASGIEHTGGMTKIAIYQFIYQYFCILHVYQIKLNQIRHFQSQSIFLVIFVYQIMYQMHTKSYNELKFETTLYQLTYQIKF